MEFRHVIKDTIIMTRFEFYGNLNKYHDTNSLEHRESPLKGSQRQNAKYIRREGEPGNYRYIYEEVNKPNGTKQVVAEQWNIDDYSKAIDDEEKRKKKFWNNTDLKSLRIEPTIKMIEDYKQGKCSGKDVLDYMDSKYYEFLSELHGKDLEEDLNKAIKKDEKEIADGDKPYHVDKFIHRIERNIEDIQNAIEKENKMNQQNYENRKNADKYAEEDRWTDYNDKKEREESLKKYSKEMGLNEKQTELLNKYIKSNDYSDLKALEKELSSTEQAVLNSYLMRLQKESFMGHRVRKDGSLR